MKISLSTVFLCFLYGVILAQNTPVLVKNIAPNPKSSDPRNFVSLGDLVFFKTDESPGSPVGIPRTTGIWSSDGTIAGTIVSDQDTASGRVFSNLVAVGSNVFFIKTNWLDYQTGSRTLFKITAPNLAPNPIGDTWTSNFSLSGQQPVAHKNKVFFVKNNQIWQSDGTEAGTAVYFDPPADWLPNYERRVGELASNGDSLYFINYRWQLDGPYSGGDLWRISGDTGDPGTALLADIYVATNGGGGYFGQQADLSSPNGQALLTVTTQSGAGGNHFSGPVTLFTPGFAQFSTGAITTNGGSLQYSPAVAGYHFFILTHEEQWTLLNQFIHLNNALWVTPPGGSKVLLKRFAAQANGSGTQVGTAGNLVFFAANDSTGTGQELWRSDGTPDGTFLLKDIYPGNDDARIKGFASDGTNVYFSAFDGSTWGIWKSNGSPGGTSKLADFPTTNVEPPIGQMFVQGETLYFSGNDGPSGYELWKYNGGTISTDHLTTEAADFQIFPNPADRSVTITMPSAGSAISGRVFNQLGILEKSFSRPAHADGSLELDVSDLQNGLYMLQITLPGLRTAIKKLVVQRPY